MHVNLRVRTFRSPSDYFRTRFSVSRFLLLMRMRYFVDGKREDVFHFCTGPATTAGCSHRRIMVDVEAVSMVGGTIFHREMRREISQNLGPQPLWRKMRCSRTAQEKFVLDRAFTLSRGAQRELSLLCMWTSCLVTPRVKLPLRQRSPIFPYRVASLLFRPI